MYYSKNHLWFQLFNNTVLVGLTFYAQTQLGPLIFVDLPKQGQIINKDEISLGFESKKSVQELSLPFTATVINNNHKLSERPTLINDSPYEYGWLIKIQPTEIINWEQSEIFLSEKEYNKFLLTL